MIKELVPAGYAGCGYERAGKQWRFRDRLTVYHDGRARFDRWCYGEAAGLVCSVWAERIEPDGTLVWDFSGCYAAAKDAVPQRITQIGAAEIALDGLDSAWQTLEPFRADGANGYSRGAVIIKRFFKGKSNRKNKEG